MEQLKPCPFCGNEFPTLTKCYGNIYIVACPQCQTYFGCDCTAGHDRSKEETIARWNSRVNENLLITVKQFLKKIGS